MRYVEDAEQEKEVIDGRYVVENEVRIASRRIIFAVDPDQKAENRFLTCFYRHNDLFGEYFEILVSDDYFEMMNNFGDRIKADVMMLEKEQREIGMDDISCLDNAQLLQVGRNVDITEQIVAIKPNCLLYGYQNIAHQLYYVNGGNGALANSRGSACFGYNLYTGKSTRIERRDVFGIVKPDFVPDFAKQTMESIRQKERERNREER